MQVISSKLSEVKVIEPSVFADERGFFFESFNLKKFNEEVVECNSFVQDNHSQSCIGVLRGLHYQIKHCQAKLVRVVQGEIFDVAVDIRRSSPRFGQWFGVHLSAENKKQLWLPEGFAHGFYTCSEQAEVVYKATDYYAPEHERCIAWDDPTLNIQWPVAMKKPMVSAKDQAGKAFKDAELFQ